MKREKIYFVVFTFILVIFFTQIISADIIIEKKPQEVYNLGDVIVIPGKIKVLSDTSGMLNIDLLCSGHMTNFFKNGINLKSGGEKSFEASLVLTKNIIGETKGICKIKATLLDEFILTDEFEISDEINVSFELEKSSFSPGENQIIKGNAIKENGKDANGFVVMEIIEGNSTVISETSTVSNGIFSINLTFSPEMKAGNYSLKVSSYEQDSLKTKTNQGSLTKQISIIQVPTNLEISFENKSIEPGNNLKVKAILRDQTGEKILGTISFITIKNQNGKILEQKEMQTDEFLEYPISYKTPASNWTIVALSNKIYSETKFEILEKESVYIELINKTIILKNTGNVPYNQTVLIKIGNESVNIDTYLQVGEEKKYLLTAPNGVYNVEVITEKGSMLTSDVALTGNSINAKEASESLVTAAKYPLVWIFLIFLLGFVAFVLYKRSRKKSFFGHMTSKMSSRIHSKKESSTENSFPDKKSFFVTRNPAQISLSIKGEKQKSVVLGIHIKNLHDLQSKKGAFKETLQKIIEEAENENSYTYESGSYLFFIFAPVKTRTFSNEKSALGLAQKTITILKEHNRKFKDKIDFGLAIGQGTIVAKEHSESKTGRTIMHFMAMGNLMQILKKLSSHSKGEILLDEKANSNLKEHAKTEKHGSKEKTYYSVKELKDSEEHKKFIRRFLERMEGE